MFKRFLDSFKKRLDKFAEGVVDVIYDRRSDFPARILGGFLKALSYIFSTIVQFRYFLYRKRIFRDAPLGCLVVVVGNLTVGGTGKTPIVEKFARELTKRNRKVAILSRGYKSKSDTKIEKFKRWLTHSNEQISRVVSDGKNILLDSEMAGDEPYMLARNLPGVIVIVDRNRVRGGHFAIKEFGADTLILDDGFQYLPLRGQIQLLLVDKTNPFGNKSLLPRGILREPVKHLKRASYIFLTKSDGNRSIELENFIREYNKDAEFIECAHIPQYVINFETDERKELSLLKGKSVACFSAIAMPESFENFIREMGADIIYNERFLDHHRFTDRELEDFFNTAKSLEADFVVTTEKDAVRINKDFKASIPFYYTRLDIDIISGDEDFEKAVDRICFKDRQRAFLQK